MSRYERVGLPWSGPIAMDVSDCTTSQEVMEKAGLNFEVKKCELVARMPFSINGDNIVNETMGDFARQGMIYRDCPNAYATYRTDKNIPLGLVKSKYEVVQNIDAFKFFDDAIGPGKAVWQTAGNFGYGHRIFVSAKLPVETRVGDDKIDNYLLFSNSHDGSMSVNIMFTPVRVWCFNMLNSAKHSADSFIRLRHTSTVRDRIQMGAQVLAAACEHAVHSQELYNSLATMKMNDKQVMDYLANLVLTDKELEALNIFDKDNGIKKLMYRDYLTMERTGISTRKANKITAMFEYYQDGIGQQPIVGTAWGAYNAVTGYYANVDNMRGEKRLDSLLYGGANKVMLEGLNTVEMFAQAS